MYKALLALLLCCSLASAQSINGGGGGGAGTGTVTSVAVTTANGVSGSVANPTTTPAITVTLGAITPTSAAIGGGTAITSSGAGGTLGPLAYYAQGAYYTAGCVSGLDMNNATDTPITVSIIPGYTRFRIQTISFRPASGAFGTGTLGLYTAASRGGVTLASQNTFVGLSPGDNVANGILLLTVGSGVLVSTIIKPTTLGTANTLYLNVQTAQGAASTADVCIYGIPIL